MFSWMIFAATVLYRWSTTTLGGDLAVHVSLAAGGLFCLAAVAYTYAPPSIENWRDGADGERRTARKLCVFEGLSEWLVIHDLPWPGSSRGNIDHVVVNGATVYVLDTKNWWGRFSVQHNELRHRRIDHPEQRNERIDDSGLIAQKKALEQHFWESAKLKIDIKMVRVVWTKFDERLFEKNGVVTVHGDELVTYLRSDATAMCEVKDRIRQALTVLGAGR